MLGAIAGDIIGSSYEKFADNVKTVDFELFPEGRFRYTDDTVQTLAVAKWLLEDETHSPDSFRDILRQLCLEHFVGFSRKTTCWLKSDTDKPYNSIGNGSAMRVGPVGLYADSLEQAMMLAMTTASVTHNTYEGIRGAMATAACVFLAKKHTDKGVIKELVEKTFGYNLSRSVDEIRPVYGLDYLPPSQRLTEWRSDTCPGSVPEAIECYLEGNDFESVVRLAVSLGGDSDTVAAIAGSIAAADYGVPEFITRRCEGIMPEDLKNILYNFEQNYN